MNNIDAAEQAYKNGYEAGMKDGLNNITQAYKIAMRHLAVVNIIVMASFVALAIFFGKWWIALFAALFFAWPKDQTVKKYYRICDGCGKHSEYTDSYNDALDKAKTAGWIHFADTNKDYCPECRGKL